MKHDPKLPAASEAAKADPVPEPAKEQSAGKRKRKFLAAAAALALMAGGYQAQHWWTTSRFLVGTDNAYVQADVALISSRVQGYAEEILVSENDRVTAGDVLMRLEDGDYVIALERARSRVETAARVIKRIEAQADAARALAEQARAGLQAAEARYKSAKSRFARVKGLNERNVAAQAQLDVAVEGLDTSAANVAQAKAAVASADAQVAVLQAQHAEAESQRRELSLAAEQAERDLDLTVLRAPAPGIIANLAVEEGDLVSPGKRLAALVAESGLFVEANFKETQMEGIRRGAVVHLAFDALPGQEFEGTVVSASPATGAVFSLLPPENATGNFTKITQRVPVRISIPDEALATGQLRAGLSAEAEVDSRTAPEALPRLAAAD